MDPSKLPIDININKLLDWILDRRICPRDWQKNVLPIRNKISLAIQDMPENQEITALLNGTTLNYFNSLKIVEILRETEKNTKNILGMYSSQRMKDWNSINSLYQQNSVYLAEAANILQRNVIYEVPALKKQIHKCQQLQNECEDKQVSSKKSVNEINQQIKQFCAELGIAGQSVEDELNDLPNQINPIYDEIVKRAKKLENEVNFYTNYAAYFLERDPNDCLSTLKFVLKNGNKTVFEWRTGKEPASIERPAQSNYFISSSKNKNEDKKTDNENEIVWDDFVTSEVPAASQEECEIDWGDFDAAADSAAGQVATETLGEDVRLELDAIDLDKLRSEIQVEGTGIFIPEDGIAKGNDALYLLEFSETRNIFINDLIRLETFLLQKLNELKNDSDNILIAWIMQEAPKSLQNFTEKDCRSFIGNVQQLLAYLKQKRVEQLFRVIDSPKYLNRLHDQYKQKLKSIDRCLRNQEALKLKLNDLVREEQELKQNMKLIVEKTKELQKQVAQDLSKRYNNVRVNIMGEINLL